MTVINTLLSDININSENFVSLHDDISTWLYENCSSPVTIQLVAGPLPTQTITPLHYDGSLLHGSSNVSSEFAATWLNDAEYVVQAQKDEIAASKRQTNPATDYQPSRMISSFHNAHEAAKFEKMLAR